MKFILVVFFISIFILGCSNNLNTPNHKVVQSTSVQTSQTQIKASENQIQSILETKIKDQNSLDTSTIVENPNKIAILFGSKVILKYAHEAINTVNSYVLNSNKELQIIVFDSFEEDKNKLQRQIDLIKEQNITKVIALITPNFSGNLEFNPNTSYYFPLIHKSKSMFPTLPNLLFGSIDYEQQIKHLVKHIKTDNIVEFYDDSSLGNNLHQNLKENVNLIYEKKIDDNNGRYRYFIQNNKRLKDYALILNTPIVKSSILLSQLTAYKKSPTQAYSTQLNYNSLVLSLTQHDDRKNLIIANSIGKLPKNLKEFSDLNSLNTSFRWVNYATLVGMELLVNENLENFEDLNIRENQVIYPIKLYEVRKSSFKEITP